jgi:hypothetical protein
MRRRRIRPPRSPGHRRHGAGKDQPGLRQRRAEVGGAGGAHLGEAEGDGAACGGAIAGEVGGKAVAVPNLDGRGGERGAAAEAEGVDGGLADLDVAEQAWRPGGAGGVVAWGASAPSPSPLRCRRTTLPPDRFYGGRSSAFGASLGPPFTERQTATKPPAEKLVRDIR